MGKKKTRSSMTSKGQRRNIVAGVKEVRQARNAFVRLDNVASAWRKGKNPWVTVAGPSSDKRFVRVRANDVWGNPKTNTSYGIFRSKGDE